MARRYVAPDGEKFKKRDEAVIYMNDNNLPGAPVVVEEEVKTKAKTKTKTWSSKNKKPFKCNAPNCKYEGKTEQAWVSHAKSKGHYHHGYKKMLDSGAHMIVKPSAGAKSTALAKTTKKDDKKKVAEKPKDARDEVKTQLEDNFEKKYGRDYDVFIRITDGFYNLIKDKLPEGVTYHKPDDNHLIFIPKGKYREFDFLMYLHDEVEIEMEIRDMLYALSHFQANKAEDETIALECWDIGEYRKENITGITDIGGCLKVDVRGNSEKIPAQAVIDILTKFDAKSKLACVGGSWIYTYKRPTPQTASKGVTKGGKKSGGSQFSGRGGTGNNRRGIRGGRQTSLEDQDWEDKMSRRGHRGHHGFGGNTHWYHGAEEEEDIVNEIFEAQSYGYASSWNSSVPKSTYPRTPTWHPVYGVAKGMIIIDRIVDYIETYYPQN
jgi:hypothetical protein